MNKNVLILWEAYFISFPRSLWIILAIVTAWLGSYYFYFSHIPAYFRNAEKIGVLLESIAASYICSIFFYFVTVHINKVRVEMRNGEILQPTVFFIIHKYSRVMNSINPKILGESLGEKEFMETVQIATWKTKGTLMQSGAFGNSFYAKQFPEALEDLRNSVSSRIRSLPLEARNKLSKLEFHPLWDFLEESPDLKQKSEEIIGEFLAKKLFEIKTLLESISRELNIIFEWKDIPTFQIRIFK